MASVNRYRSGVVATVAMPTNSSYPIEEGDLCAVASTKAVPANELADSGTAAQNRAAFAAAFAGVALHKTGLQTSETSFKLTTDPGYTLLAVSGDFEFDCAATAWAPGDLVGVYNDATINSNQKVAKVTSYAEAIGVAVVPYDALGATTTTVIVRIRSPLVHEEIIYGSGQ